MSLQTFSVHTLLEFLEQWKRRCLANVKCEEEAALQLQAWIEEVRQEANAKRREQRYAKGR